MALPGQSISDIREVHSHPMAINQCLPYLRGYNNIQLIESADTALSAKKIASEQTKGIGAIASKHAAEMYGLDILAEGIETSKKNYTRFFIVQGPSQEIPKEDFNKASIYVRVSHVKGSLMRVLDEIQKHDINLSKIQSYPVLGEINQYYIHLDLEFDNQDLFHRLYQQLNQCTIFKEIIGLYKRADIYDY